MMLRVSRRNMVWRRLSQQRCHGCMHFCNSEIRGAHAPAGPRPRAPHGVGSAGSPRGACLDRDDRATKTSPHPRRPDFWYSTIFGTQRSGSTGPRGPCPRAPHGVGSAGEPAGGEVWSSLTQFPKRAPPSPTRFVQVGDAGRQEPTGSSPVLPTAWECWGARGGGSLVQFDPVP